MKNIILKNINYLYLLSLLVILIFYFFPGDIVSYFIYGNFDTPHDRKQNPVAYVVHSLLNTGGYSINHTLIFSYITVGVFFIYFKKKNLYLGLFFLIFFSVLFELIHLIIPNRAFEFIDLISNLIGIALALFLLFIYKKFKK